MNDGLKNNVMTIIGTMVLDFSPVFTNCIEDWNVHYFGSDHLCAISWLSSSGDNGSPKIMVST